ncbi:MULTISPECIES: DUF5597 domain-containing protein [Streptomyces]|uniref:DUF5597 domain-containing protein n=10 Tax=Streptomyces TaxID=1883 RepID=A0AAP6BFZ9_9ACTN|nr:MULTISPECIES: DUF5597 domain-containing protein [Streptomyces]MBP5933126.1 hypothetical protein [Streptomyces sp. LBUM 1479]MBP5940983.1 hypothetical protein [Streptomyces sp. LBUM 1476]ELP66329.1 glycosyl hydrolase [Streptomyces turgidiscabies Car8]KND42104.1 hypothetical protein IQ64_25600 [Streptomyces stelliscabiei]MBE1595500.1 hypothetical protein [Streptomyces stelliscabiei]
MQHHGIDQATGQLIVGGTPYLIRGIEVHNSTSSHADYLEPVWKRCADAAVNTVLAPVSWELVEPTEGEFDFHLVDAMLSGARDHELKLVLLWFGSWKNASSSYVPAWVKLDPVRFPLQVDEAGDPLDNLSPFSTNNRDADAAAFAAFMEHLARVDGREKTVIMVQVENEVGLLGAPRSYGADAAAAWAAPVPAALAEALRNGASPYVQAPDEPSTPTWDLLTGDSDRKAELFMAWHYACYIEHVAAAGLARYDIPLFANAWLDSSVPNGSESANIAVAGGSAPGVFPSGGPLPHVSAAWKLAAPSLAFLAPDVYFGDFDIPFKRYADTNTTLFVPEMRADCHGVSHSFLAIGQYGAIGVSPFGFDSLDDDRTVELRRIYAQLAALENDILAAQPRGRVRGFRVPASKEETFALGKYEFVIRAYPEHGNGERFGYGLLLQFDDDVFIAVGDNFTVCPRSPDGRPVAILQADELVAGTGRLRPRRRLNGDETLSGTGIRIAEHPAPMHGFMATSGIPSGVVRFSLYFPGAPRGTAAPDY